ncbi:MAG: site-specific integrase [Euryarchaeota archaeon]|nr:site-specific integrase [Euryarchaeota archaeon]
MKKLFSDFETFLSVDEDRRPSTIDDALRTLRRMLKNGFDAKTFMRGIRPARTTGRDWLAKRRKEVGYGGYNSDVKVLNALARMKGWEELHFKRQTEPRPRKKALPVERFGPVFDLPRRPHERRESHLRGRALLQFALLVPIRKSEIWKLREKDLDPIASTVEIDDPAKNGLRRKMIVPRELWDPFNPFELWRKWRPKVKGDPGAIWTTKLGRGRGDGEARVMHPNSIYTNLRQVCKRAGINVNFLVTRSTGLTVGHRAGASKDALQYHAGHADQRSIERYISESQERYEAEMRKIRIPRIVPKTRREEEEEQ